MNFHYALHETDTRGEVDGRELPRQTTVQLYSGLHLHRVHGREPDVRFLTADDVEEAVDTEARVLLPRALRALGHVRSVL